MPQTQKKTPAGGSCVPAEGEAVIGEARTRKFGGRARRLVRGQMRFQHRQHVINGRDSDQEVDDRHMDART